MLVTRDSSVNIAIKLVIDCLLAGLVGDESGLWILSMVGSLRWIPQCTQKRQFV